MIIAFRQPIIIIDSGGGATPNWLKQMDGDAGKDQFWSYQDQKEDGADATFSDCDQMSSAGEKEDHQIKIVRSIKTHTLNQGARVYTKIW